MPVTQAEHDRNLKAPAVCELLPLRDLPRGDNIMVRTNGAFVAGYELGGIQSYFATDDDRTRFETQFNQVSNLFHSNVASATLPQSESLESTLLSGNAADVPNVSPEFQALYGTVMAQSSAPPTIRAVTDMTDAQAQDAMKRAIEIDALADAELSESDVSTPDDGVGFEPENLEREDDPASEGCDPAEAVLLADRSGNAIKIPYVFNQLNRKLARWAFRACTGADLKLPSFALADDGVLIERRGKILSASDWIPEDSSITSLTAGKGLCIRYPIRMQEDLLFARRRDAEPATTVRVRASKGRGLCLLYRLHAFACGSAA